MKEHVRFWKHSPSGCRRMYGSWRWFRIGAQGEIQQQQCGPGKGRSAAGDLHMDWK